MWIEKYTIITLKYKKVYFIKFGYFKAVFGKKYARIHTEYLKAKNTDLNYKAGLCLLERKGREV